MSAGVLDWFRGTGGYSVSVPAMDGALKPNDALDSCAVRHECPAPDNLVLVDGKVHFSSGADLLALDGESRAAQVDRFSSDITCLAGRGSALAIGLEGGSLSIRGGAFDGLSLDSVAGRKIVCPVAALFESDDTLLLGLGSQQYAPSRWKWDLLQGGRSGSVWRIELASGRSTLLRDGMAFPYGIAVTPSGRLLVSESWRHRIVEIKGTKQHVVVDELPFYPARIANAVQGELLVCGFAPRRQMVEFILHEPQFLQRMMAEIPERYWMAPALSSGQSFLEPLQGGQIRHHGVLKTWSPTKSYGLLARMDENGSFRESLHCRAGGRRHGVTSALETGTSILVAAKGGGMVLSITDQGG